MIKLIEHEHELDSELLNKTLCGKKMLSYMRENEHFIFNSKYRHSPHISIENQEAI